MGIGSDAKVFVVVRIAFDAMGGKTVVSHDPKHVVAVLGDSRRRGRARGRASLALAAYDRPVRTGGECVLQMARPSSLS